MYNYFLLIGKLEKYDVQEKTFTIRLVNDDLFNLSYADIFSKEKEADLFSTEKPVEEKLKMSMNRPIGVRGYTKIGETGGYNLIPTYIKEFEEPHK